MKAKNGLELVIASALLAENTRRLIVSRKSLRARVQASLTCRWYICGVVHHSIRPLYPVATRTSTVISCNNTSGGERHGSHLGGCGDISPYGIIGIQVSQTYFLSRGLAEKRYKTECRVH